MSENIKVLQGENYKDFRGKIASLNQLGFEGIERVYFIQNESTDIVRAWHGHQFEKKWFYCVKGSFSLGFVKIDNWDNPSVDLIAETFILSGEKSEIIELPEGYANGIKAREEGSILMVFSGKRYEEALSDSWRYDADLRLDWSKF